MSDAFDVDTSSRSLRTISTKNLTVPQKPDGEKKSSQNANAKMIPQFDRVANNRKTLL
jgi:hypothetical protein